MNNYTDLVTKMADVYLEAVRTLETEITRLSSENELLRIELRELREKTDTYIERMN